MPDPNVVYVVTSVVVLGLIAWVVVVLVRPAVKQPSVPAARDQGVPKASTDVPAATAMGPGVASPDRPHKLNPHTEIHDDPTGADAVDVQVSLAGTEEDDEPTGPSALILVTAVGRTDMGLKRKNNEDAYAILEDHHLFVIADGMGRHAAGEVASRLCVDAISEAFQKNSFGSHRDRSLPRRAAKLQAAILLANDQVLNASRENVAQRGMGTTIVCAYFSPNNQRVCIAHVGDSRCYRLRGDKLVQLTTDHTLRAAGVQDVSAGVLSRAIGVDQDVEVDVTMESPLPGDTYLLCSDGLSQMVKDDEIRATLQAKSDLAEATKALIDKANLGGGRDNITAILVRVEDAKAASMKARAAAQGLGEQLR